MAWSPTTFSNASPYEPVHPINGNTHFLPPAKDQFDSLWFDTYVPSIDCPDKNLVEIYNYRWSVVRRHIAYTVPSVGYILTEFVKVTDYAGAYGGIVAATGHHIYEARWFRDTSVLESYIDYWLKGPGKPLVRMYSVWMADVVWQKYLIDGNLEYAKEMLPYLIEQWHGWEKDGKWNQDLGLYWQVPVFDAMEYTIGSYQTSDPYHGGDGYRPTLSVYQHADALAIARIANLANDKPTSESFTKRAYSLKSSTLTHLWNSTQHHFFHVMKENNPTLSHLDGKEEIGYTPWYFNLPPDTSEYAESWSYLFNTSVFWGDYGPATAQKDHRFFYYEADTCCRWNGPSWPFSTSITLTALANFLVNYENHGSVTRESYYKLLDVYTRSQYKDGTPYVAEALNGYTGRWIYDNWNWSEHYFHSSYVDLVLSGLFGIRPVADVEGRLSLELKPLVPENWDYYGVENLNFQGDLITILWDRFGNKYNQCKGLCIFQNGQQVFHLATQNLPAHMQVSLSPSSYKPPLKTIYNSCKNLASNPQRVPSLTKSTASSADPSHPVTEVNDGVILHDAIPSNRWISAPNTGDSQWIDFEFPSSLKNVAAVDIHFYTDSHISLPKNYDVLYWVDGWWTKGWKSVPGQRRVFDASIDGELNRVWVQRGGWESPKLRVLFSGVSEFGVGITEIAVWGDCDEGYVRKVASDAQAQFVVQSDEDNEFQP
ncbi:hypothetical protein HDU79_009904 [Rhizoclosmatium sp. JEL0117]|nr:hypothetical protein HDU79_009904 [Rhizoclosmatium sp. JEL0117]